ncbi:MAG TPA: hypothetical protein VLX85_09760 [Stellaceae bacterium]|nr:hypothetical protein [Stellaceae bacterium]
MSDHRAELGRVTEVVLVVAFLALSTVAYGTFFVEAGDVMTASVPADSTDFYRAGENPWTSAIVTPTPSQEQLAGRAPRRSRGDR